MALLSPLVFYALWPWIWFDTVPRLAEYVTFHLQHAYYNMEFWGQTYWKPPMPRGYAWVMVVATVPGITLVLAAIGIVVGIALTTGLRRSGLRSVFRDPSGQKRLLAPSLLTLGLWLVGVAFNLAPWLSTRTPIFGGTKHWLTAYPFLCLLAGWGYVVVVRQLQSALYCWSCLSSRWHRYSGFALQILLVASVATGPLVMTWSSHPWGLSFYTPLVGGASGAATLGLNRTFWGYTTGAIQNELNQQVRARGRVYIHDTAMQSWKQLVRDGRLRSDLIGEWHIHNADTALYHHEPHMSRVEHQIWVNFGTTSPAIMGIYQGVPVIWVYQRPVSAGPTTQQ
jgi:hypothetical protein